MNDDYLWDRTGEPDPDVEHLERVLGKYRYQAKPLSPALQTQMNQRSAGWMKYAAIAAAVLIALAGFWIYKTQIKSATNPIQVTQTPPPEEPRRAEETLPIVKEKPTQQIVASRTSHDRVRGVPREPSIDSSVETMPFPDSDVVAERQPLINPFIDAETARHIERAQLLLRAFRNTRDTAQPDPEIAYERQRSRGLLSKNILLRRDAEAKGNLPVEELLGSLEPFLLDLANLPDKPSRDDVRSIKDRMQKKEIISALQVYSAPTLAQVF